MNNMRKARTAAAILLAVFVMLSSSAATMGFGVQGAIDAASVSGGASVADVSSASGAASQRAGMELQLLAQKSYDVIPEVVADEAPQNLSDRDYPDVEDIPGHDEYVANPPAEAKGEPAAAYAAASIRPMADDTIAIASVEVVNGGAIQAQYRNSVYQGRGFATYGEDPAKYYTTMRDASFTDSRVFNFEVVVPSAGLPDLEDPVNAATYLAGVNWTYGDIPLAEWRNGNAFNGANSFIQLSSQSISRIVGGANAGDYLLKASIVFQTPYAVGNTNLATNIPYDSYSSISQSGFNRAFMLNGRAGDFPNAGKGIGTYTLAASTASGEIGSRQVKLNLYDSFRRWEEIDS